MELYDVRRTTFACREWTDDPVSDETLDMYQELQKVVEEINSPELQEALRQLQESMQNLDLQQRENLRVRAEVEHNQKEAQRFAQQIYELEQQIQWHERQAQELARRISRGFCNDSRVGK